jgi:hypothetical protein
MASVVRFALAAVTWLALASGCGSRLGPGSFDGAVFRRGPVALAVPPVPGAWRRVEVSEESLAFRDDAHQATILVNGRCFAADTHTPLLALTNHLLMGTTEREFVSQEVEPFDQREALHTKLLAKWDGVRMFVDIFVVSKDGCVYDFVYTGSPAFSEEGAALFEAFVRNVHTLPGSGVSR